MRIPNLIQLIFKNEFTLAKPRDIIHPYCNRDNSSFKMPTNAMLSVSKKSTSSKDHYFNPPIFKNDPIPETPMSMLN